MSFHAIPITCIWEYVTRYNLPDWWEVALLLLDRKVVYSVNKREEK